ncbi:hypothetical protein [Gymnodinialimonas ulvae]|uniref:hypothetical protein n=1 Tax=Gymnodinialimonas ulvae TaxID=3126504 RepID=UPI0030AAB4A4
MVDRRLLGRPVVRVLLTLPLLLAACVGPQIYVTEIGPLQVQADRNVIVFSPSDLPDGSVIEPIPIQGGLVVRTLNGRAVPFEARGPALEAMQAHCLDYVIDSVPLYFGWRDVAGTGHWSAAGCDAAGGE